MQRNMFASITVLLVAISLVTAVPLGAQEVLEDPGSAENRESAEPDLRFLSPQRISVDQGQTFMLRFAVPDAGIDDLAITLPELPSGLVGAESPVVIARGLNDLEVRLSVRAAAAGRYVVEPIVVEGPEGPRRTGDVLVEVRDPTTGEVPFRARWRVLEEQVVQAQSVPVLLEITGIDTFAYPELGTVRAPQTGLFEEIGGIGSVTSRDIAGTTLYTLPVAAFLFTPTTAGEVTLPATSIQAVGIEVRVAPAMLDVNPLPSTVQGSGAVGQYTLSATVDAQSLTVGESGTLNLLLSGVGNLPVVEFPNVEFEGLVEVGRSQESRLVPDRESLAGYTGERRLTIRYEPAEAGGTTAAIRIARFASYDPESGMVDTIPAQSIDVAVLGQDALPPTNRVAPPAELLTVDRLVGVQWIPFSRMSWVYFLFLLGPVLFGGIRLLSVRRVAVVALVPMFLGSALFPRIDHVRLERAAAIAEEGRPAVAAVLYDLELQGAPWHAGLHFNRGVLALEANDAVDAMFHFRRAVRLAPEVQRFRAVLSEAQEYFGVGSQTSIAWYLRPDLLVLALMLVWTGFWLLLAFHGRVRRTLGLVTLFMLAIVLAGGWWWSARQAAVEEGIVRETVTVRRIPDHEARPWLQLSAASAVRVELSYQEFYLVRTAAGVTGWVPRTALLIQGDT